mmetsp:Transcript_6255/g.18541  ORF Transcript_6255/g.18541 Transcript_6255/m.18541 type:complete len:248 (+) Transcript_6255:1935-2678(+)
MTPSNSSNSTSGASSGLGATGNGGALGTNAVADALSDESGAAGGGGGGCFSAKVLPSVIAIVFVSLYISAASGDKSGKDSNDRTCGRAFGGATYLRTNTESPPDKMRFPSKFICPCKQDIGIGIFVTPSGPTCGFVDRHNLPPFHVDAVATRSAAAGGLFAILSKICIDSSQNSVNNKRAFFVKYPAVAASECSTTFVKGHNALTSFLASSKSHLHGTDINISQNFFKVILKLSFDMISATNAACFA